MDVYQRNPEAIEEGHIKIKEAVKNLDIITHDKKLHEGGKVIRDKALALMKRYNMLPSDAFIGAIAIMNEIYNIATLDVPFAKSIAQETNVHVYLPDNLY